jgi:hypothetical protein
LHTSDHYEEKAVHCLRLAQASSYEPSKALLLEMARAWLNLAERARKRENRPELAPATPQHREHTTTQ